MLTSRTRVILRSFRPFCTTSVLGGRKHQITGLKVSKRANPGVDLRYKLLRQGEKTNFDDFEEDPEFDPDSDFSEVHKSHRQHEREARELDEKISFWRVRDKYFKVKLPNLMTWGEKEHVRNLHADDPETWTPQYISEKFPIDVRKVDRLLRAKWFPKDELRARTHDEKVAQNWRMLESGELEVPEQLKSHLLSLKSRPQMAFEFVPRRKLSENIQTRNSEFLSIVQKPKEVVKAEPQLKITKPLSQEPARGERRMTLDELNRHLEEDEEEEKKSLVSSEVPSKFADESSLNAVALKDLSMPAVTDHIRIPKKLWRRGATYRVGDCFYGDDGNLLFRVPGLAK